MPQFYKTIKVFGVDNNKMLTVNENGVIGNANITPENIDNIDDRVSTLEGSLTDISEQLTDINGESISVIN